MSAVEFLPLAVLGAVLGLDVVSFPQAMFSRPIVAGTLAGIFLGEPERGLLFGATLECFALETLPFGASRYPEWGSASVIGAALFATHPNDTPGAFATAILAGLAAAWVSGWSMVQLRKLNAYWARRRHEAVARGSLRVVTGLQLYGMTADLIRGAALTWVLLLALAPIQRDLLARWNGNLHLERAVVAAVAATVAAGAMWKIFHATAWARWLFAMGLGAGLFALGVR